MKYYIIAGEASGDLHGSNLIAALRQLDDTAKIRCWGGEKMQAAGATVVKHYRELAFMGFIEVVKNLRTIFKNLAFCKADILQYRPDALILIDYPGFNLRIAKWAKEQGFKVIYYISPQVWAWKESRVKGIKKYVDKMLVILPFEKAFYAKWDYNVEYVGHPLVKVIEDFKATNLQPSSTTFNHLQPPSTSINILQPSSGIVAVLPGSRAQEINIKLPIMLSVARHFPNYQFVVAKAPGMAADFYDQFVTGFSNVAVVNDDTYALLAKASAALVTSGTATLETALFGVPEVVCYKGSAVSYAIAKRLLTIKYICLVNLIMDKEVVKELIQEALTEENIVAELHQLLTNTTRQQQLQQDYTELKNLLSKGGNASANAALSIWQYLSN
jgi:lipid-A-disaccharide synthase